MASAEFRGPQEWDEWTDWLAAGLHGRNSWRLSVLQRRGHPLFPSRRLARLHGAVS